jgi:hypothetical protein
MIGYGWGNVCYIVIFLPEEYLLYSKVSGGKVYYIVNIPGEGLLCGRFTIRHRLYVRRTHFSRCEVRPLGMGNSLVLRTQNESKWWVVTECIVVCAPFTKKTTYRQGRCFTSYSACYCPAQLFRVCCILQWHCVLLVW